MRKDRDNSYNSSRTGWSSNDYNIKNHLFMWSERIANGEPKKKQRKRVSSPLFHIT